MCKKKGNEKWSCLRRFSYGFTLIFQYLVFLTKDFKTHPRRYLLIQSLQCIHQNNMWNLVKVHTKDTRTTSLTCSGVFIVNFEHISHIVLVICFVEKFSVTLKVHVSLKWSVNFWRFLKKVVAVALRFIW